MGQSVTWHNRRWQPALQAQGLADYDDFLTARTDEPVWTRSTTTTYRLDVVDPDSGKETGLYLKRYQYRHRRWRFLFRSDKPNVEWRNYEFLRRHVGPIVPDVVATGRHRRWLMLHSAFILTVELEGCVTLDRYARGHWVAKPDKEERARQKGLIQAAAELVRRMHDLGFYHIDLQWRNIMIRFGKSPDEVEVFLIDAPRGGRRWWGPMRRHGRLRDLSSIDKLARTFLTRTQRLRWFKLYSRERRITPSGRRLIEAVLADRDAYEQGKARQLRRDG